MSNSFPLYFVIDQAEKSLNITIYSDESNNPDVFMAKISYSEVKSSRVLEDGQLLIHYLWDWESLKLDSHSRFLVREDDLTQIISSHFPIDTRKHFWFLVENVDDPTGTYNKNCPLPLYYLSKINTEVDANRWACGASIFPLDEMIKDPFNIRDIVHQVPLKWQVSSAEEYFLWDYIHSHSEKVFLYGTSPIDRCLRNEKIEGQMQTTENKDLILENCLRLFACIFLLRLNGHTGFLGFGLANELPRALSLLQSDDSGYILQASIDNGCAVSFLIPYVDWVCREVLRKQNR